MTPLHPQTLRADHSDINYRNIAVREDDETSTRSTETKIGTPSVSTAASRADDAISSRPLGTHAHASDSYSDPPPLDSPSPFRVEDMTSSDPSRAQSYASSNDANAPPLSSPSLPRGDNVIYISDPDPSGWRYSIVYNATRLQPSVQLPGALQPVGDTQASGEVKFPEPDISEHPSNRPPSVQLSGPSQPVASSHFSGDAQTHRPNGSDRVSNVAASIEVPGSPRPSARDQGSNEIQYHGPCYMTGGAGERENTMEDNEGCSTTSKSEPEIPESWGYLSCCIPIFKTRTARSLTRNSPSNR